MVDHALLRSVAEEPAINFKGIVWDDLASRPQRANIVLEYVGRMPNQNNNKYAKHFRFFSGDAEQARISTINGDSQFAPGIDDGQVRMWINEALRKQRAGFSQTYYSQLNNYVSDTTWSPGGGSFRLSNVVGYDHGKCTTRIKLKVGKDGTVHAYPTIEDATPNGSVANPSSEE
ncbi:MAG TPA: hypothetical protein VFY06_08400 [Verrucomicrobiae bacterium]|nr:hypothetical protein [Verrucomicrobiae bacterium]